MSTYSVRSGDTLSALAQKFNTTVDALAKANHISNPNLIRVGQRLTIPDKFESGSRGGGSHTVRSGDTLSALASRYGTSVNALAKANHISDPNRIFVGQKLTIPGRSGSRPSSGDNFERPSKPSSEPSSRPTGPSGPVRDDDGRKFPTSKDGTPVFRQGDPQWGSRILGHNSSIAAAGCAMTSTAMAISKISGKVINPGELDAYLDKHGGYAGDGLMWDKAAQAAGLHASKSAWNLSTINKQIDAGRPVVIGVDYKAGSNGGANGTDHWITVTGRGKDANGHAVYYANDPATGTQITLREQGGRLTGGRGYKTTGELVTFSGGNPHPGGVSGPTKTDGKADAGGKGGVTLAQLRKIMPDLPASKAEKYLPYLNKAMAEAHIDTPKRKAAFLAQLAHESVQLRYMEEIASGAAYEGRRDLGNTHPGDGVRYKGRGPIQLTGRANYRAAGKALGIDLEGNPRRAADPDVGFRTAAWFWTTHGLNGLADKGNFREITHRINGGYNGESSREAYYRRALNVLT